MHDFIQHLSFNSQAPFIPARAASEPLRAVLLSFNEAPVWTYRPSPRRRTRERRHVGSKSLNSQLSLFN